MIAIIFLPCFLLIFGLICTIPPSKKLLALFSQDFSANKCIKVPSNSTMKHQENHYKSHNVTSTTVGLTSVFATFDKNNDGYITKQELRESLKNIGISAEENDVSEMVRRVDLNQDGLIDFNEFCELFVSINSKQPLGDHRVVDEGRDEEDLKEAFDVFDENKDGVITVEELGLVLSSLGFSEGKQLESCREMIRRVDTDGDGTVNFDEFKEMMRSGFGRLVSVS